MAGESPLARLAHLARLLDEHRGPLRADLRREYGIDLDEVLAERSIKPLVLMDYIEHLSPQAALWRAIDPDAMWSLDAMLLAALVDELRVLRWEFERKNFKGKKRPPDPIVRPGVAPPADRSTFGRGSAMSLDEMDAWLRATPADGWRRADT